MLTGEQVKKMHQSVLDRRGNCWNYFDEMAIEINKLLENEPKEFKITLTVPKELTEKLDKIQEQLDSKTVYIPIPQEKGETIIMKCSTDWSYFNPQEKSCKTCEQGICWDGEHWAPTCLQEIFSDCFPSNGYKHWQPKQESR